jgi:hypothetical protein
MNTTVPLAPVELDAGGAKFLAVAEVFFHPDLARGRYLPMSLQLATGKIVRVRLSSGQVAAVLAQLSQLGIRAAE